MGGIFGGKRSEEPYMAGPYMAGQTPYEPTLFSDRVFDRLTAMSAVSDCSLVSSDGTSYPVHRATLLQQSKILRGLLSDVACTATLPIDEDAATLRLLISGMYDVNIQVSKCTVEPLLELSRKYDVDDIRLNCERYLSEEPLSTSTLPRHIRLACTFGLNSARKRCLDYIAAADNYNRLARQHGEDWCKDLPGEVIIAIMNRRMREQRQEREARYQQLLDYVCELHIDHHNNKFQKFRQRRDELGF